MTASGETTPRWEVDEDSYLIWTSQAERGVAIEDLLSVAEGRRRGQEWVVVAYDALVADVRAARQYEQLRESITAEAELVGGDDHHYTGTDVAQILRALLSGETD